MHTAIIIIIGLNRINFFLGLHIQPWVLLSRITVQHLQILID